MGATFRRQDSGFFHPFEFEKRCLDVTKLNTHTSDLNLIVTATLELNVAVRKMAGQVASTVEARPALTAKGIRQEDLRSPHGVVQVATPDANAPHIEFAYHANGNRLHAAIEDIQPHVRHWLSDRNRVDAGSRRFRDRVVRDIV